MIPTDGYLLVAGVVFTLSLFLIMLLIHYKSVVQIELLQYRLDHVQRDMARYMGIVLEEPRKFLDADLDEEKEVKK